MFARQRSHFNAPYPLEDDPASHRVHDSIAAREYEPGGHFAQKEIPGSDPIGQGAQEVAGIVKVYSSKGHFVHSEAPSTLV